MSAAAAFQVLSGTALPLWAAALLTPAANACLHVVLLSLLFLGGVVERLGGELAPSHITRATEYAQPFLLATLYILTSDAPWLRPLV